MSSKAEWFRDDITWCGDHDCPLINCVRNPKNIRNPNALHSFAAFRLTDECPIYQMEQNAAQEREDDRS